MKTIWRFGIGMGVVTSAYVYLQYLLGFHTHDLETGRLTGMLAALIPLIGIPLGLHLYRERELGGAMSFGEAFRGGLAMSLLLGVVTALFYLIYHHWIHPDAAQLYAEVAERSMTEAGLPREQIDAQMDAIQQSRRPSIQIPSTLFSTLLFGGVISSVAGIILRRQP